MRNFMATLLLSQGVPMISHGDELARTQQGNNNVYCQDNELSWIDWTPSHEKEAFFQFVAQLVRLRLSQPVLRRRRYFQGRSIRGGGVKDVAWLAPDGREMTDDAWNADFVRSIGMLLSGHAIEEVDERGERITGDTVLVLLNAHTDKVPFTMPPLEPDQQWQRLLDTTEEHATERLYKPTTRYPLQGRSVAVFRLVPPLRERRRVSTKAQEPDTQPAAAPATPEPVAVGAES
jgi:glycogen operon protein